VICVEDDSRAAGIMVNSSPCFTRFAEGMRVEITGRMATTSGQRLIDAVTIRLISGPGGTLADDRPLKPVGTAGKSVVGVGQDNTGLLATVWGEVTYKAGDNSYFCVDDGSGRDDGLGHAGVPVVVSDLVTPITPLPTTGYHNVTGVIGKKDLGGGLVAVVRPRIAADIR
jgi:hypothetical protein